MCNGCIASVSGQLETIDRTDFNEGEVPDEEIEFDSFDDVSDFYNHDED